MIMNKKAGDFGAGYLVILILVYFTVFILSIDSSNQIMAESATNLSEYDYASQIDGYGLLNNGYCNNPRYDYNAETGDRTESQKASHLDCERSKGVISKDDCEVIEGCYWDNATTNYWLWTTVGDATCLGDINASYYNIETAGALNLVKSHENSEFFKLSSITICNHPEVIGNRSLCDDFSCTWTTEDIENVEPTYKGLKSTLGEVFTFSYDFGVENSTLRYLLNFLFVIVPLLLMIIGIYFLLPVVH